MKILPYHADGDPDANRKQDCGLPGENNMAKNTGEGSRKGSVDDRTQVKNPVTGDYVKRNEDPHSKADGEFMAVKKDGKPFKGVAKEPDKRRTPK